MPITPTYPGIYIEELPNSTHTIAPAPTSITVFVGYTHPFKTKPENVGKAVQIFSFTDYEREFGGLFNSDIFDHNLAYSVNQFFLNGGTNAYVVGLLPQYRDNTYTPLVIVDNNGKSHPNPPPATVTIGNIIFTALEPTDANHLMAVTINNINSTKNTADITITYGSRAETFRTVTLNPTDTQNYIESRIGTAKKYVSSLVTVSPNGANYTWPATDQVGISLINLPNPSSLLPTFATVFSPSDFTDVFQQDSPLDKLPIFNLLVLPGIADNGIWSEALAFCERKQAFLIMDPPQQAAADTSSSPLPLIATLMGSVPKSTNGALYFPYLLSKDPLTSN